MRKDKLSNAGEAKVRQLIREGLDRLPQQEKEERGLIPFTPSIPKTEEERTSYIENVLQPFAEGRYTEEDLREELTERIEEMDLAIDTSLPVSQLQQELRAKLQAMADEELLAVGVFGTPWTEEDAAFTKTEQEDWIYIHLLGVIFRRSRHPAIRDFIVKYFNEALETYEEALRREAGEIIAVPLLTGNILPPEELPSPYKEFADKLKRLGLLNGSKLAAHEDIHKAFKEGRLPKEERGDYHALKHWIKINESYKKSGNWYTVISTDVYLDCPDAQAAFVDYVEDTYQTTIQNAAHFMKLTGITNRGKYVKGEWVQPETEEEASINAAKELEDILHSGRCYWYSQAIERALAKGAKYKELLQIKPEAYRLPESWENGFASNQYEVMLWAVKGEFLLDEPGGASIAPDLRAIAKELGAPYAFVMDAFNFRNWKRN